MAESLIGTLKTFSPFSVSHLSYLAESLIGTLKTRNIRSVSIANNLAESLIGTLKTQIEKSWFTKIIEKSRKPYRHAKNFVSWFSSFFFTKFLAESLIGTLKTKKHR